MAGGVSAVGAAGLLPAVAPGGTVSVSLAVSHLELALFAGLYAPQTVAGTSPGAQLVFQVRIDGGLRACYRWARPFRTDALRRHARRRLSARSEGVTSPENGDALYLGTDVGPSLRLKLFGPVAVRATLEGSVMWVRPSFRFNGAVAHEVSAFGAVAALGAEILFR